MNIIVLIKEVPDMERVRFDRERGVVDRASASAEINPFDLYALQAAADLKAEYGAYVTVVSMGPERCADSLQDAVARGADACVCVTDRRFGGADTYATSKTLAAAVARLDYDLILCGEKSVDGDTAQVGAGVAELLDIPHSYYVEKIDVGEGEVTLTTADICGSKQQRRMKLPALVSVGRSIASPRLPELKRKIDSISADVKMLGLEDLTALSEDEVGAKGSPTKVSKIVIPEDSRRDGEIFRDEISFIEAVKAAARGGGKS
ncbi:MAG: electron transfer flavoprotein subunit beta/FixA family protein [Defluviitaleaceae bacterium]|nr:electron transfer flavoprotein subunit beta/FixA family protein [Defluviitaleaceae bacterium]